MPLQYLLVINYEWTSWGSFQNVSKHLQVFAAHGLQGLNNIGFQRRRIICATKKKKKAAKLRL